MTWKRDLLMVGAGAAAAWLLKPEKKHKGGGSDWWETIPGEKGIVLEPDFIEEEEEDVYEAETDEGYFVRVDGRTVGKVRRTDYSPDSQWWAGYWDSAGDWTDGPDDFETKVDAAEWLKFR